jgi:hypothetical protein
MKTRLCASVESSRSVVNISHDRPCNLQHLIPSQISKLPNQSCRIHATITIPSPKHSKLTFVTTRKNNRIGRMFAMPIANTPRLRFAVGATNGIDSIACRTIRGTCYHRVCGAGAQKRRNGPEPLRRPPCGTNTRWIASCDMRGCHIRNKSDPSPPWWEMDRYPKCRRY